MFFSMAKNKFLKYYIMSIYEDFPFDHPIWNVSNPETVREKYHAIYDEFINHIKQQTGADSEIYPSSRKHKKYMVFSKLKNGKYGMVHFGDIRYKDYTITGNEDKRRYFMYRFPEVKDDTYSPYMLSKYLLW